MIRHQAGHRRRAAVTFAAFAIMLLLPWSGVAGNWSQTYVSNTTFHPGGIGLSALNSVTYNEMIWTNNGDTGKVTLCDSSYACYPYVASNDGSVYDTRSISYGRGKCYSWISNAKDMYVIDCYASNF